MVGGFVTFLLMTLAQYRGCAVELKLSVPPSLQLDCAGAPHQVTINFGTRPPEIPLGNALKIIADRTQSRGAARVWVDQSVLNLNLAATPVDPPGGAQPSLDVVQQLLSQAHASASVGICLVPQGGYEVRLLK